MSTRHKSLFILLILLMAGMAVAQEITGTILGTVKDPSGAVVPNATVTVTNTDKNVLLRTVTTSADGEFVAPLLPIGHYTLTATAPGFDTTVQKDITLNVNDKLTYNLVVRVGMAETKVTVEASALQVEQQSATASALIGGTEVRGLSLNNRNYEQLVALQPGVSYGGGDQLYVGVMNPNGDSNSVDFAINGARENANNWTIDGADNVDRGSNSTLLNYPSVDSIAEFKVLRGMYNAEFGRSMGGQINVITKSGDSTFHGSLYEFFRNDVLNANNFFNKHWDPAESPWVERQPLRYNNFGWTLGGPIFIPGKYNTARNKTFFFYSQEFRRIITSATSSPGVVPDAGMKQGIFQDPVCVAFDATGACTATGTSIPTSQWDPAAAAYVQDWFSKIANPQNPEFLTLISPLRNVYNYRQEMIKVDHVFGPRLTATFRYMNDSIPTEEPTGLWTGLNVPGIATTSTNAPGRNYLGRATITFSPNFLMETGYAYSYGAIVSRNIGLAATKNSPDIVNAIRLPFTNTLGRVPNVWFDGGEWFGGFGNYDDFNRNHNWFANFTRVTGRHTLKWGALYNKYNKNENSGGGNNGEFGFTYTGLDATGIDPENPDTPNVGRLKFEQSWANFLLGNSLRFTQASKDTVADMHQNQFELFLQDEWRVRHNLTVAFGVRYSLYRQPTDGNSILTNFDPQLYDPAKAPEIDPTTGLIVPGGNPNYDPLNGIIIGGDWSQYGHKSPWGTATASQTTTNFAPRFGFAWDPSGTGKTAVRGGYGVFFDSPTVGFVEDNTWVNPPFVTSISISDAKFSDPAQSGSVKVNLSPPPLRIGAVDWHLPYTQQWSLDIQHEITKDFLLDIGYYGMKGTHLLGGINLNQVRPGVAEAAGLIGPGGEFPNGVPSEDLDLLNGLRPYKGYSHINAVEPWFSSNYHSLQVSAQKKFKGNSLINVAYTFSKNLTTSPGDRWNAPQDTYNIRANYGPASFDRRQILTLNFVYELPFMQAQQGGVGKVLGGWELSGIIAYDGGLPLTVDSGSNIDRSGQGMIVNDWAAWQALYPDMTCNPNSGADHKLTSWFNTSCFAEVPDGQLRGGNERRGQVRGPGFGRWDLSVFKNFKFTERTQLQFRAEAFNVWNHTNFSGVDTGLGGEQFGQVTSTRDPRNVQFGLKLLF